MKKKPEVWNVTHVVTNDADIRESCRKSLATARKRLKLLDDMHALDRGEIAEAIDRLEKRLAACGKGKGR